MINFRLKTAGIMKGICIIILLLCAGICYGNMASPYIKGSLPATVCSSKDVDILHENILITLNRDFKTADFDVTYDIDTRKDGMQIPLLFYAAHYNEGFKVWVDGVETSLRSIPEDVQRFANSPYDGFSDTRDSSSNEQGSADHAKLNWGVRDGMASSLQDFKYFEAVLLKGAHRIRVKYNAVPWKYKGHWNDEFSFHYSLSPARHWRSFGTLTVVLNATAFGKPIITNLGKPVSGSADSVANWDFSVLPAEDFIKITYVPVIPPFADTLIKYETGITTCLVVGYLLLHLFLIRSFRRKETPQGYPWAVVVMSIIVPALLLIVQLLVADLKNLFVPAIFVAALSCLCLLDLATKDFRNQAVVKKMPFTLITGGVMMSVFILATPLWLHMYIYHLIGNGHSDYMGIMIFILLPVVLAVYLAILFLADWRWRKFESRIN